MLTRDILSAGQWQWALENIKLYEFLFKGIHTLWSVPRALSCYSCNTSTTSLKAKSGLTNLACSCRIASMCSFYKFSFSSLCIPPYISFPARISLRIAHPLEVARPCTHPTTFATSLFPRSAIDGNDLPQAVAISTCPSSFSDCITATFIQLLFIFVIIYTNISPLCNTPLLGSLM